MPLLEEVGGHIEREGQAIGLPRVEVLSSGARGISELGPLDATGDIEGESTRVVLVGRVHVNQPTKKSEVSACITVKQGSREDIRRERAINRARRQAGVIEP